MIRYFRSTAAVYSGICGELDLAYNYPNPATKTQRTLPPEAELPHDRQGRVYLSVDAAYCQFILPGQMLPGLLASGAVEEIDEATYRAAVAGE